jgi:hypothetical protein
MPAIGLFVLLAAAILLPKGSEGALRMASPDRTRVDQMRSLVAGLDKGAFVLVDFDPDIGTYPEIRGAVRALFDDLAARDASVAVVSFTPEGRALAVAELARLERLRAAGAGILQPLDLGFVAGSEAGLVRAVEIMVPASASGPIADSVRAGGGGIGAFALAVIVSGGDLGARSWVEQVGPRLPDLPMAAIAPTFLEPELAPYLRSGQLRALLATLREGTAYAESVPGGDAPRDRPIAPLPMLVGMLVALGALAAAAFAGAAGQMSPPAAPERGA